ncbi:CBS domain [Seminavis robusta]|uniref:CBS domain n=1 Tax=Seminavis robusta TaxID=568900 RepID=A0A9N8I084_9STRA|nr:CBS domain [Seminavis robusta]|eukprot:Sro2561_g331310.1 CBS domain (227) ;mRNA; f:7081-7761
MTIFRVLVCMTIGGLLPSAAFALSQPQPPTGASAADINPQSPSRVFVSTPSKNIQRRVDDFMTPRSQMHILHPQVSCDEAISVLLSRGISGAPVVDPESGKMLGIISSSDFMFKDYSGALLNMEGSSESLANCVEMAQKIVGSTVEELMSHQVMTIKSNEAMATAADWMARNNLHRLLVVDPSDEDNLVGILTRSDVMRDVMTVVQATLPERATGVVDENAGGLQP